MSLPPKKIVPGAAEELLSGFGKTLDQIGKKLKVLDQIPGLSAVTAVLSIYALLTDEGDKKLLQKLQVIEDQLKEINLNVLQVLEIVKRLPELITQKLAEDKKNQLISRIKALSQASSGILAAYSGLTLFEVAEKIDPRQAQDLQANAEEMVKLAYEMADWGADAYPVFGQAYANYIIARQVTGYVAQDLRFVRLKMLELTEVSHLIISELSWSKREFAKNERNLLNSAAGRDIWLNCWVESIGSPSGLRFRDNWARIKGSVDAGFSFEYFEDHLQERPNQGRRPILGSGFPSQPVDVFTPDPAQDVVPNYIDHLNERARLVRLAEADAAQADKMRVAAQVLMQSLAIPLEVAIEVDKLS